MATVDIFQDGQWKTAPVLGEYEGVGEDGKPTTFVTYLDIASGNKQVTADKRSLPYKDPKEAQKERNRLAREALYPQFEEDTPVQNFSLPETGNPS